MSLRLSAQRALFDRVKSTLRCVYIAVINETKIVHFFYYDGEISKIDEDLAGDAGAEVISDFPGSYTIDWKLIRCDYPQQIVHNEGYLVYARYEE